MAKKCSYCGEMTTKPHNHKNKDFAGWAGMLNYEEFFDEKRKKRGN